MSFLTRSSVAAAGIAVLGVATVAAAADASANPAITPAPAYICAGTSYTVTITAADAAALLAQAGGANQIQFLAWPTAGGQGVPFYTTPYVPGAAVTAQWTPPSAGQWTVDALASATSGSPSQAGELTEFTVVSTTPSGASCASAGTGTGTGTGSADSIPLIGPILSALTGS